MAEVTKEMIVGEVLAKYPASRDVFMKHGLHCVGCSLNPYDSIEIGAAEFGIVGEKLDAMIKDVNEALKNSPQNAAGAGEGAEGNVVQLTERAASKLREMAKAESKEGYGLRVGLVPGGCSGYSYAMDFEEKNREGDSVSDAWGIKVFVSQEAALKLAGTVIDYVESVRGSGFTMNNPNVKKGCGCGSSVGF